MPDIEAVQLKLIFPAQPLEPYKGHSAKAAEKLGHGLVWAWHDSAPRIASWECRWCDRVAFDRVAPDGTTSTDLMGNATMKPRCPGPERIEPMKGPGAQRAEGLGHRLVWAWVDYAPLWAMWKCTMCEMPVGDCVSRKDGERWEPESCGDAAFEPCPGATA